MELLKIVQESVELKTIETLKETDYGCEGIDDVCCGNCGGEYLSEDKVKKHLISSQISLLEAELERKKGMMKNITRDNYDGDDLNSAREYYGIWAITWDEIIRYEDGQSKVLEEDITYLTEQIAEIKKTNL